MRIRKSFFSILVILFPLISEGQKMKVLDTIPRPDPYMALAESIAIDGNDNIWVAGQVGNQWVVRKGEQKGLKWSTVDTLDHGGASSILVSSKNEVYVVGSANRDDGLRSWIVRKTSDQGKTWKTVDKFVYKEQSNAFANKIFETPDHHIIVCGVSSDRWIVRRSANGGGSWAVIDDFQLAPGNMAMPQSGAASADGVLIIVGTVWRPEVKGGEMDIGWLTRASHDGGKTWINSDNLYSDGKEVGRTKANDVVVTKAGTWLVGGSTYYDATLKESPTGTVHRWIIRASQDKGKTWKIVDTYKPETEKQDYPKNSEVTYSDFHALALGPRAEIYAFGFVQPNGWKVRKSVDEGKTWNTVLPISDNREYTNRRGGLTVHSVTGDLYLGYPGNGTEWTVKEWHPNS